MFEESWHRQSLNPLLQGRHDVVEDPECHVTQHYTILAQIEIPQTLFVLSRCVLNLEGLVPGVLFNSVQQPQGVAELEHAEVEILAFLHYALQSVQVTRQQQPEFLVVVDTIRVPYEEACIPGNSGGNVTATLGFNSIIR